MEGEQKTFVMFFIFALSVVFHVFSKFDHNQGGRTKIRAIAEAGPSRVVYVSCNVATQARDAALFREAGYEAVKVQPVDMFCWTSGIENVALFGKMT